MLTLVPNALGRVFTYGFQTMAYYIEIFVKLSNQINNIHERTLRLVYQDYDVSFEELSTSDGLVTVDERNIQALAVQLFKLSMVLLTKS